ncbi:hypothetical protein K491DRAFT_717196 [Lophiostoma macrostomum CBS 122681]|uniref:G-protein coupled receptors family 2 profile 2 domain-containing protein n=1 Tax=Lophiostoma macrostomum CBS 122681 TaxID=1314788 RepID=A0A6A6T394_9PLEO|nr:hypothetical protein K491DRAFT_717196 [Lophiostoma macrostomum CBS 122681]
MANLELDRVLLERTVLSAPIDPVKLRTLNIVILAVSILSMLGAGWIILSFCLFKQVRTFRHQLILGLAISDFFMGANFMSSCAVGLSSGPLSAPKNKAFCSFNGFMTQFFVIQTDYWVLIIAVCTYFILANYKHLSSWVQEHRIILWCLPWGFSALWAAIGLGVAGYGGIGAWCWFTSDKVRLLVNFVPRWIIILIVLGLYARLYFIIYKAHNRFMSFSNGNTPHSFEPETESVSSTRRIGHPALPMQLSLGMSAKETDIECVDPISNGQTHVRQPSRMLKKMAYQMMSYPLVYMLIWTIPTAIRIYQAVTKRPAPFGIATVDKACIVIQGFADAIIYGVNETSLHVWRERFRRQPPTAPTPIEVNIQHDIRIERNARSPVDAVSL